MASNVSSESIKMIAESIGIASLSDAAGKLLAGKVTSCLKQVIQESVKFQGKAKRKRLLTHDVDFSLRCLNVAPVYGYQVDSAEDGLPFRMASGGGRELVFLDTEKEIDLQKYAVNPVLPKVPPEVALKAHWLSIEGVQPAIPENPPPVSKQEQRVASIDPLAASGTAASGSAVASTRDKLSKKKRLETVTLKQYATHELSVEQQLYYKEITEACVGSDEGRRAEALQSLAYDSGLHQMLPRLCTFISEGVKVNVVQNNLALLIYLMRMVKAILDNSSLYLEKYLHEITPTIVTCIVSKQLCMRPEVDNHWALRDFAARLLAQCCKTYNTSTNSIQVRLTRVLTKAIDSGVPLSSTYGALSALCELGSDVQRTLLFRRIKAVGDRISEITTNSGTASERAAAEHIKTLLTRVVPNTLKQTRPAPDVLEDYKSEFGSFFGPLLHQAVSRARTATNPLVPAAGSASNQGSSGGNFSGVARPSPSTGQTPSGTRYVILSQTQQQQQLQGSVTVNTSSFNVRINPK